jgi:tRNA nucleotidyltransferase/poly(A) polymerase
MKLEKLDETRVEKALITLSDTDEEHAQLSGEVKRCEEAIKQAKAHAFLLASGTVAEREAQAIDSPGYKNAVAEWVENYKQFKILDNKRQHEIRITEIWQTLSANRRKGSL